MKSVDVLLNVILLTVFATTTAVVNYDLQECFEYKKNFWLVGFAFHTTSVQFKDECLRACLTSSLRGSPCLSAMHVPSDDRCVLANESQLTHPELFLPNDAHATFTVNYYTNICVDLPPGAGGQVEARLMGFRGAQGVLQMAQQKGHNPKIMVVMTGLAAGRDYIIYYAPNLEPSMCRKMSSIRKADVGEKLVTVDADPTGMGIQPWTEIDWHILDDSVIGKVLVVAESVSGVVIDCGQIKIKGNQSDWEAALNTAPLAVGTLPLHALCVFLIFLLH